MKNEITVKEQKRIEEMDAGISFAKSFLNRNYLNNLKNEHVPMCHYSGINKIRFFHVQRFTYDQNENINDKLVSVYSVLQKFDANLFVVLNSDENGVSLYIGTTCEKDVSLVSKALMKSFKGNFIGSETDNLNNPKIEELITDIRTSKMKYSERTVSSVTVIPSARDEDKDKYVQGIEKFIETMQGELYTAVFIARPVSHEELDYRKSGYEDIYSTLSSFSKTSLAYGENYSKAVTEGLYENFSNTVNKSITDTVGYSTGTNGSISVGRNTGGSIGGGGGSYTYGSNKSKTTGTSSGRNWSRAVTDGTAETMGKGTNSSDTETTGDSRTLTIEYQNKTVDSILNKIDEQLERIKLCESYGVWEAAAYFIADDIQTSVMAANSFQGLMLGDNTNVEKSFINTWGPNEKDKAKTVLDYITHGQHPLIRINQNGYDCLVTPGTYISGQELPLLIGMPKKSTRGLTVNSMYDFGRNIFVKNNINNDNSKNISIGKIYHMGIRENTDVNLNINSFASHCFITGSTGSGKSNTVLCLLEEFYKNNIPFLVIEPAKGEYRRDIGGIPGIHVYTTNPYHGEVLKINPFVFPEEIHVLEHLDRLIEIFNACWEMYAAMPALLKTAMERCYQRKGWDLLNSIYLPDGPRIYPSVKDLTEVLPQVIEESSYSNDTRSDYTGALVTRVSSLANGITGQIFSGLYATDEKSLFDENCIVDLSRVGSMETKSLLMGILVLKLNEYRMANATGSNQKLKHITVLEEAHNLLKRTSTEQGQESANLIGKSVEMISNSIAEMRTYGEGFIIVDQSPTTVDISAIKNTNTKIVMRLPEQGDCEAMANAMSLTKEQTTELAKLETGVAAIIQNNWLETVLCNVNRATDKYSKIYNKVTYNQIKTLRSKVVMELLYQYYDDNVLSLSKLYNVIDLVEIDEDKKNEMKYTLKSFINHMSLFANDFKYFITFVCELLNCDDIFNILEYQLANLDLDNIDKNVEKRIIQWYQECQRLLRNYVEIEEKYIEFILKRIIYTKSIKTNKYIYTKILEILFKE